MEKRALTIHDLSELKRISDVQIHPDGNQYIYVQTSVNEQESYNSHLYVGQLQEQTISHAWTFGDVKDHSPRYSPDGKSVVFLSNRSGTSQLWMMPTTGGEPQQLTFLRHGAGAPIWSPDGQQLLFSAPVAAGTIVYNEGERTREEKKEAQEKKAKEPLRVTRLKYKSDAKGFHDDTVLQLFLYTVDTRETTQLTKEDFDRNASSWHPNGNVISYTANRYSDHELVSDVYQLDLETHKSEQVTDGKGTYGLPAWSQDGQSFAYVGNTKTHAGATQNELYVVKDGNTVNLTKDYDMQFPDSMISDFNSGSSSPGFLWKTNDTLYITASSNGRTGLYTIDLNQSLQPIFLEDAHVFDFHYNHVQDEVIAGISFPTEPGDYYLLSEETPQRLTGINQSLLEDVQLIEPTTLSFTAHDGTTIEGWLLKPYDFKEGEKYPLITEIHGGPHAMYGYAFFHELQALAGKGYGVLYTNPRGSYGYGQTFVDLVRGDYGGDDYRDIMSAVDQTIESVEWIDVDRLGVTGGSYGGFMTNWIVTKTNRFKAAVTQRSISNWLSFYGVSDIGFYFTEWEIGAHLHEDPEKLWNHSPLKYAKDVETPLLILHGELDYRCPIEQAEQWFITLKHLGKETEFVRFPNANHELSRSGPPTLRKKRLEEIIMWFEKYVKNA
ncbi:S9 family peptidase [Geomicrobium sediminis]|uniref:Acylaminoacyl-peptidase n=1 Tax=Geomicrobium sediminis TaxID=1347788 RepID=A0ABS2PFK1_9BACL|nr:S9 family peptidase [Geomicrobium sediminis]MBM7633886.1 acylaminoacyl-peptidase [Geomicrobium sediminis]